MARIKIGGLREQNLLLDSKLTVGRSSGCSWMTDGGQLFPAGVEELCVLSRCQCPRPRQWGASILRVFISEEQNLQGARE